MTRKLAALFNDYAEYHKTKGNIASHSIGITMITLSILGLLARVTFGNPGFYEELFRPDLGLTLIGFSILYYLYVDWKIALPFFLVLLGLYFIGRAIPMRGLIGLQVVGWGFQYLGHLYFEKNKPAFYRGLHHPFIGPLWIFSKVVGYTDEL